MLTTDGEARRTASLYEATCVDEPAGAALCTIGTGAVRCGSHSGRNVDTTNSAATAIVAACAKMGQRRRMGDRGIIRKFHSKPSAYERNRGQARSASLKSLAFAPSRKNAIFMNENEKPDKTRRNLVVATSAVGAAAGLGAAVPFVVSMWPSERTRAAGAPVEVDLTRIAPGQLGVIEWRGKPVWVLRRTKEMIESLKSVEPRLSDPQSKASEQ